MLANKSNKVNTFNKLSKQQKKILKTLGFLVDLVINTKGKIKYSPIYKKIIFIPNRTVRIPINYVSRMIGQINEDGGGWVMNTKQSNSFRASFSRSIKKLSQRGLLIQYTSMNSIKTRNICLTLLGLIYCKKLNDIRRRLKK